MKHWRGCKMISSEAIKTAARQFCSNEIKNGFKPEGLYHWKDLNHQPIHWRVRLKHPISGKKSIKPFFHDGTRFVLGENKSITSKPPYGANQIEKSNQIWIVEGEPKVDLLNKLGVKAVTSGSATSANTVDWSSIAKRKVIIWPDNDEAGFKYANKVAEILKDISCSIEIVDVQKLELLEGGDCIDWHAKNPNATAEALKLLPLVNLNNQNEEIVATELEAPILFDEIDTPDIPAKLLPGIFGRFARDLASATETPEALSVMTILGVLSCVLSKRFVVSPKEGWLEPLNIYTLVALPPANNKSLVLKHCTSPLSEWEKQQATILQPEIERQRSERKTQERRIETLRTKAAKEDDIIDRKNLSDEINELEANLIEPKVLPQLFINDVTPETLCSQIHDQDGRLAIFSDEGGIIETLSGLYSGGNANIDIVLKGIDGGDVRVRRKDKSFNLNPYLTVGLIVQPVVIQNMASKKSFSGNGMLERFLYAIPHSKLGFRTHDKPSLSDSMKGAYSEKIHELINITQLNKDYSNQPKVLILSAEAFVIWKTFQISVERRLRPEGDLNPCLGWGGKISGFVLRIAGLLHVAEYGANAYEISEKSMESAVAFGDALIEHALCAYNMMGIDETTALAQHIYKWIVNNSKASFTQTEITKATRNKKGVNSNKRMIALQELIDRHIVSKAVSNETKKPTTTYLVHKLAIRDRLK
jgi:replicative DNA helicase